MNTPGISVKVSCCWWLTTCTVMKSNLFKNNCSLLADESECTLCPNKKQPPKQIAVFQ